MINSVQARLKPPSLLRFIAPCLCLLFILAATKADRTYAQTDAYWTYDASGRVNWVTTADLDLDGIEELLLISGQSDFLVLDAAGNLHWQENTAGEPIVQVAVLNTTQNSQPTRQIVIGTRNQLRWYTATGDPTWVVDLVSAPIHIAPYDHDQDGNESTLIASRNGRLQLYDNDTGELIWNYVGNAELPNIRNARPQLQVADFNQDGQQDIAFLYRAQRGFDRLVRVSESGILVWGLTIEERVTAVAHANFPNAHIAVGTENGRVILYDGRSGGQIWTHTPNQPITHLATTTIDNQPTLIAGTANGTAIAYNQTGRPLWQKDLSNNRRQSVTAIRATPETDHPLFEQPAQLTVSLATGNAFSENDAPELLILNKRGQVLWRSTTLYDNALTRLVDLNQDGYFELLRLSFSNISLQDVNLTSAGQSYRVAWRSRINATPMMLVPVSDTADSRVAVAADDSRVYLFGANSGVLHWQSEPFGTTIKQLTPISSQNGTALLIGYHLENGNGELSLHALNGQPLWSQPYQLDAPLAATHLTDLNQSDPPEILIAHTTGTIEALSLTGRQLWQTEINDIPQAIYTITDQAATKLLIVTHNTLIHISHKGEILTQKNFSVPVIASQKQTDNTLLLSQNDGRLIQLDQDGALIAEQAITPPFPWLHLAITETDRLQQLISQIDDQEGEVIYRGLLPPEPQHDTLVFVGDSLGRIQVWTDEARLVRQFDLGSGIIDAIPAPNTLAYTADSFLIATENGVIHRLNREANRPPFLTNPQVQLNDNQYGVSIDVIETDGDLVLVNLLGYDENSASWRILGEQTAVQQNERLIWLVAPDPEVTRYRFSYDDGTFVGDINPSPNLFPTPVNLLRRVLLITIPLFVLALGLLIFRSDFYRSRRIQRIYRQIITNPQHTLLNLSAVYEAIRPRPDLLLNFASRARRDKAFVLAHMLEGLYLFTSQPDSGLQVLDHSLNDENAQQLGWQNIDLWRTTINHTLALLRVSSLAELTALAPDIAWLTKENHPFSDAFQLLNRPFASLQEAERVPHAPDRLTYFYETRQLLEQAQADNLTGLPTISRDMTHVLLTRWAGLVNVWIDDWRGRPWISATLQTKRIISNEIIPIVLEIQNRGQAAAEQLHVAVQQNPAFSVINAEQILPILGAGRTNTITIQISLHTTTPFRLIFTIKYADNQGNNHTFDFADMVHLLDRSEPFRPIPNPYAPGTPLRQESKLFVGREALLQDVVEQVRQQKQSILVMVGQRRTGKTSALLQLETVMPNHILPVYVDGQSLGILPGIGAFLHDLAWLISDALLAHQAVELDVPELDIWEKDPLHLFQRTFLPAVHGALPDQGRILLIFDEFEVFESLVRDGIFPSTFFPFLRHLMQHSSELSFIFAGTHRLEEFASDYWSVLFNLALHRQISYLTSEAAVSLITQPVDGYLIYDDLALDRIWRATAGHPYFLQLVCYTMVAYANQKQTQYITISDVNESFKEMLQLGEVHFAYLWRESTFIEQVFLTAVAHIHPAGEPIDLFPLAEKLRKYDFVFALAEVRDAFRQLERRGIVQEMRHSGRLLYTMRIDLVRLWVQENRSFGRLREEM